MSSGQRKHPVSAEVALKTLDAALDEEWNDAVANEEPLPEDLSDSAACLEWGRSLLATGLRFPTAIDECHSDDEEYRMAARNGGVIPVAIQERMHAERHAAEHQLTLDIDVEG